MVADQYVTVKTRASVPLQVPVAHVPAWPETIEPVTPKDCAAPLPVAEAAERPRE